MTCAFVNIPRQTAFDWLYY